MNNNQLNNILDILRKRKESAQLKRRLRDASDPFSIGEEEFRRLYRFTREVGFWLFVQIQADLQTPNSRCTKIPVVVMFVGTLHFLAHGSYQKSAGQDFRSSMSQPSVSRIIHKVGNVLVNRMHHLVKFPQDLQRITAIKNSFYAYCGIPQYAYCIDCTHINLSGNFLKLGDLEFPRLTFLNWKNVFSLNVQIICDLDLNILNMNARLPIWQGSDVQNYLKRCYNNGDTASWLLGDSGYPLQPYLMIYNYKIK